MKARMQIDVAGLQQALRQLPYHMSKSSHRAAARAGAAELARAIKAGAPVRTGRLKRSIAVAAGGRGEGARFKVYFKGAVYRIAHLLEFGTAHSGARPFVRPGIEKAAGPAVKAAADKLGEHLAKNAEKLAGAGGRKHFLRGFRAEARAARFRRR